MSLPRWISFDFFEHDGKWYANLLLKFDKKVSESS